MHNGLTWSKGTNTAFASAKPLGIHSFMLTYQTKFGIEQKKQLVIDLLANPYLLEKFKVQTN